MRDVNKKVVGFVILTFNSEKYITKCLDSILNLSNIQPVIVITDNGSSDNTRSILKQYETQFQSRKINYKISYLKRNRGTTYSRNLGIKYLLSEKVPFLCILDSDTTINNQAIQQLLLALAVAPNVGIIGPQMSNSTKNIQCSARKFPTLTCKILKAAPIAKWQKRGEKLESYNFTDKEAIQEVDYLLSACWMLNSKTVELVGLLDEKIFYAPEDVDYCLRIKKAGLKCYYVPQAKIAHEYQRLSKKKIISLINMHHALGLIYYFLKHRYLFTAPITQKCPKEHQK